MSALRWLFLRPLREQDSSQLSLLVAFAIALGLEGALSVTYKTTYRTIQAGYADALFAVARI